MTDQTTKSLRELAIAKAEATAKALAERDQQDREERQRRVLERVASFATRILGPVAQGAEWTLEASDPDGSYGWDYAVAEIDGERFEFGYPRYSGTRETFRHLVRCPDPLHLPAYMGSKRNIHSLNDLGEVLRNDSDEDYYPCALCKERREAQQAAAAEQAPAVPPLPTRGEALLLAAKYAGEAEGYYQAGGDNQAPATTAAAISQAYSVLYLNLLTEQHEGGE
jgi:hypothetical protein